VRLYFVPPEIEAFTGWNPSRCHSNIGNDKLNGARCEELADIIEGDRFPARGGREPVVSPQFAERQLSHDPELGVHDADNCSSSGCSQLAKNRHSTHRRVMSLIEDIPQKRKRPKPFRVAERFVEQPSPKLLLPTLDSVTGHGNGSCVPRRGTGGLTPKKKASKRLIHGVYPPTEVCDYARVPWPSERPLLIPWQQP
jgi:hypothetical protein